MLKTLLACSTAAVCAAIIVGFVPRPDSAAASALAQSSKTEALSVATETAAMGSVSGSGVSALTRPAIHAPEVVVNRVFRGDRLTQAPERRAQRENPGSIGEAPVLKRPPLGCDGAFSPIADPGRAQIFKRCMT
jgi:hypothetical protein